MWIHECTNSHKFCLSPTVQRDGQWYPTRLLDLYNGDDGGSRARLVETQEVEPLGPYITLSHCWGNRKDVPELTEQNRSQFKIEIPSVPKTFKDAIAVARKLTYGICGLTVCASSRKGTIRRIGRKRVQSCTRSTLTLYSTLRRPRLQTVWVVFFSLTDLVCPLAKY